MGRRPHIAESAADLRARYNLRAPDAIQVATALFMGSTTLLTNDRGLSTVAEIDTIILDDLFG